MNYTDELGRALANGEVDYNWTYLRRLLQDVPGAVPPDLRLRAGGPLRPSEMDNNFERAYAEILRFDPQAVAPVLRRNVQMPLSPATIDNNFRVLENGVLTALYGDVKPLFAPILDGSIPLDPAFTFTRATTSTYIENGVLKTAAANVPVFEDGGLRIEPPDTNLIKWGRDLVGSGWNGIAASAGFDSTVRGVDLYKIYSNINGSATRWRNTLTLDPGEYYFSVLLMRGNLDKADVFITVSAPSTAVNSKYGIDFVNKSISNGRLIDLGGGLFKIESKSFSVTATATAYLQLYIGGYNALVSQGDYVFAGAAQISYLERSSYIPTNGSLVTRATDSASITGANFANIYNPASGSLILSGDSYYMRSDIANNVLRLSDQIAIRRDVDGYLYLVRAGQSDLQILSSNQATNNIGLAWGSNGLDIFVNGAKKHADLVIPGGTIDSLILADSDTAAQNIKRLGIYKQRLTDELLEGLTS